MNKILIIALFFGLNATVAISQSVEAQDMSASTFSSDEMINQSVFMDAEEKICYVDLEKVPVNLKQAAIIDHRGDEVVVVSLSDQPVDTIIELDYSKLPAGSYMLELQSYTGKTLSVIEL